MIKITSPEEIEKILSLKREGKSIYKISKETNLNPNTVKKWLKKNGIEYKNEKYDFSHKRKNKFNEEALVKMYLNGNTVEEIMSTLSIARSLVKHYLEKNNIVINKGKQSTKGTFSEEEKNEIIDLYVNKKRGAKYIGEIFDRSDNNITYWLKKWNVIITDRKIISQTIRDLYGPTSGFKGKSHTEETKKNMSISVTESWNKEDRIAIIGKSRTYNTIIGKVLGTYEVAYLQRLVDEKKELPTIPKKRIKTDFGTYLPDFEYNDKFIEIKSKFTLEVAQGLYSDSKGKKSDKQWKKIKWTNENIKKVEIIVIDSKEAKLLFKKAIETGLLLDNIKFK